MTKIQQQAAEYLNQGQYNEAIALYEQCINADPTVISHYWYLGLAWLLQGEPAEAQAIWLSAITQGTPEEVDSWMVELLEILTTTANQLLADKKLQQAEQIYWQILELDAHQAEAYYNLGNVLAQQSNFDQAIDCWQQAIELNPDLIEAYQNQGAVLQKLENFAEAIACYLKALALQPDYQTAYNLGLCFSQLGRLEEAIAYFKQSLELQPNFTPASSDLGFALLQQGNLDEAILLLSKVVQFNEYFAQAYCNWVESLVQQNRANDSLRTNANFFKTLQIQSQSFDAYFYLGNLLLAAKLYNLAIAVYQKSIEFKDSSSDVYFKMGQIFYEQANLEDAVTAYRRALEIKPDAAEIYLQLGKAVAEMGNYQSAIALYKKPLELPSEKSEAYFFLGIALANIGQWNEAILPLKKSLEIQPNSVDTYWHLGIAFIQIKQANEAIACWQKIMQLNPDMAHAVYDLMESLSQLGKLDASTISYQDILPIEPPNKFYESTWDWATSSRLFNKNYVRIYPPSTIDLTPPKTTDKTIHFSFRFGSIIELPASFVALVPEGRFWLNKKEDKSAIIASDNKLLADISPDFPVLSPGHPDKHPSKHSVFSIGKLPPIQKIDGSVAVLSGLLNDIYFHWLFDILPRIHLLEASGIQMAEIDKFLIQNRLPFQTETLKILGITETKILDQAEYTHLQASQLIVPSFPGTVAWMPKWTCDFLKSRFLNRQAIESVDKIERLYISRKATANRRIINEDEVVRLLTSFGFQTVILESMSVVEQAALLSHAKVVISAHGSGLTNTVFCNPGTKVIEIFSPNYVYPCYWLISNLVGLEYYYLMGENPEGFYLHKLLSPNSRTEDIFINTENLVNLLKFAGVN